MKIEIQCNTDKVKITEYVIRNIYGYCYEEDKKSERPHFQALVIDDRKSPMELVTSISYYDSESKFLGLDEGSIWCGNSNKARSISMPVTIPENAMRALISISPVKAKVSPLKENILIALFCALVFFSGMLAFNIKW